MKAGLFDRAESAYQALDGTPFDTEARLALLDLHERSRDWRAAVDVAEQLERSGTGSFASRIAHYWCELALEADAAHQTDDADAALARARDVAPTDARPLVLAGERAAARGDHAEALRLWNTLMAVRPAAFNLVVKRLCGERARGRRERERARRRLQSLYDKTPTVDLLETIASLEPDDGARRDAAAGASARASDAGGGAGAAGEPGARRAAQAAPPRPTASRRAWPRAKPPRCATRCDAPPGRCIAIVARPAASRPSTISGNARAASAGTPIRRNAWRTSDDRHAHPRTSSPQARVLVVGDAMLDRYWFGAVERISPEAPVPVVRVNPARKERLGGAANVASTSSRSGAQASC